jgi:hypothetical protein
MRRLSLQNAGNLVDMGQLAFTPGTPEVLSLAAHMEDSHELFGEVFRGVFKCIICPMLLLSGPDAFRLFAFGAHLSCCCHSIAALHDNARSCLALTMLYSDNRTESEAENFLASNPGELWALVVFNEGPSAAGAGAIYHEAAHAGLSTQVDFFG